MRKLLVYAIQGTLGVIVIVVAVIALSGGFGERIGPEPEPAVSSSPASTRVAVPAEGVPVQAVTEAALEWTSGTLVSARQTSVAARVLGRIEEIRVRAGDDVAEGDLVAVLDARELEARARQADDALGAARAQRDLAQSEKDRAATLLERGTGTRQRLDRALSDLRVAQADVDRLTQILREARAALSHTRIAAPVSGRVIDRLAEPGDTAMPGTLLLRIYDPSALRVEVPVRESLAVDLAVGQRLALQVPALDKSLDGLVDEIVPFAEAGARTLLVKLRVPADPRLFAGMYARVAVPAGPRTRLMVPESAIERIGQLAFVRVVDADGARRRRMVTTGRRDGEGRVEVLSGLRAGERVVPPERS